MVVSAACLALSVGASAQVFGMYTTAAVSELGEGCAFFSAGDARLTGGVASRFMVTSRSDFGIQLGYDRNEEIDNYGIGADYKFYIVNEDPSTPLDLALDVALGYLGGSGYSRGVMTATFIGSSLLDLDLKVMLEPYGAVGFIGQYFFGKGECAEARPEEWPCNVDDWSSNSELLVRAGTKVWLGDGYHVLAEFEYDGKASLGAAFNVVF